MQHGVHTVSINFSSGLTSAWNSIANIIPKFIGFLVILLIGWLVCRVIARIVEMILTRIGFDRLGDRSGINHALRNSSYTATTIVTKLIYYMLLLAVVQLALGVFGSNPVSAMIHSVVAWLPRAIVAVAIVVIVAAIARIVRDLVSSALSSLSYGNAVGTGLAVVIVALGLIAALNQIDVATAVTTPVLVAALTTVAGILIVGVGGGLVMPMRARWDRWLDAAERETRAARTSVTAYQQGRRDALEGTQGLRPTGPAGPDTPLGGEERPWRPDES